MTHRFVSSDLALAYDDVLLVPHFSDILPSEADISVNFGNKFRLNIPLLSAAMDTVTEKDMAIAMAQQGGLGVLHKNMSLAEQVAQVEAVKRHEAGVVWDPYTISPDTPIWQARRLMAEKKISGLPVVAPQGELLGILTNRDVRFEEDENRPASTLMTQGRANLITIHRKEVADKEKVQHLLHQHRIEKVVVVDDAYHCVGLMTVKDIEKDAEHPLACKDGYGRLRVAAAIGVGPAEFERAEALVEAGVDALVLDSAHGHSANVMRQLKRLAEHWPKGERVCLVAGNVATPAGAEALVESGADVIKVGIGPGSICTTRVISGIGYPQFSAVLQTAAWVQHHGNGATVIADGGIRYSGDITKALAAGAGAVMVGSMLAGTEESPGETYLYKGRSYKAYRGMGSLAAMAKGSADRYSQAGSANEKLVPEGVEGQTPYKGLVAAVVHQLVGGLRSGMGYTGCRTIDDLQTHSRFVQISSASGMESHTHGVQITREPPNYGGA